MKTINLPYQQTNFFSKTVLDYIKGDSKLKNFFGNAPNLEGFEQQIQERKKWQSNKGKKQYIATLVEALKTQYKGIKTSEKTQQNINILLQENTFTITTGHQLNLFTGPLYFLYKIISVINLCENLQEKFPKENFVPIYWMATEDHDFEEINYFHSFGKKTTWNSNQKGAVGKFSTEGLDAVFENFSEQLGTSENANFLKKLFSEAYIKHENLADATRYIANQLFGKYGLVIIDAGNADLKKQFTPYMQDELLEQTSYKAVSKTITALEKDYKIQVNPRETNLFYLKGTLRERIVKTGDNYKILNTSLVFTEKEILAELKQFPERFSPNVIMRPLYQEVILPNLCYVGGGGELAYWLELKQYFEIEKVPFPILLLRNSVQIISEKQAKKLKKLNISVQDIFLKQQDLLAKKVTENATTSFDFQQQKEFLQQQFDALKNIAKKTDVSFVGAVNAQEKKQLKGLENLEKRLLRAEKRKQKEYVSKITALQDSLFPKNSLEERQRNFSEYYLAYGTDFIDTLKENLKPLQLTFTVIEF